jgi:DNA mismatch repair ATPase MutS
MRLDLAKYKKLNSELREKHSEALKQIAELEKIQKRV